MNFSTIKKEYKDVPYEGYVSNTSKKIPTDIYLYLEIYLEDCMMRNSCGSIWTNNKSVKNIPNLYVFSMDENK